MTRAKIIVALRSLADLLHPVSNATTWYLFGSVDRNESNAADIDLMIVCSDARQADELRAAIDLDTLGIPLHLSLLTYEEEIEVGAIRRQDAREIFPRVETFETASMA